MTAVPENSVDATQVCKPLESKKLIFESHREVKHTDADVAEKHLTETVQLNESRDSLKPVFVKVMHKYESN